MTNLWGSGIDEIVREAGEIGKMPVDILQEQCQILNEKTEGKVIAKVALFKNPLPYGIEYVNNRVKQARSALDTQMDLTERSDRVITYEFYLTSAVMPYFKYRVFFLQYSFPIYPLLLITDFDIASELNETDQEIMCGDESEYLSSVSDILSCGTVLDAIKSLLAVVKREEIKRDSTTDEEQE